MSYLPAAPPCYLDIVPEDHRLESPTTPLLDEADSFDSPIFMYAPEFKFMPPPTYTEVRPWGEVGGSDGAGVALGAGRGVGVGVPWGSTEESPSPSHRSTPASPTTTCSEPGQRRQPPPGPGLFLLCWTRVGTFPAFSRRGISPAPGARHGRSTRRSSWDRGVRARV